MEFEREIEEHKIMLKGEHYFKILPHDSLRKYISNYGIFFLDKLESADKYILIPDGCGTISCTIDNEIVKLELWGTRTESIDIAYELNNHKFLLLIEFLPGGLYKFTNHDQSILTNKRVDLSSIDSHLELEIKKSLFENEVLDELLNRMNDIFLAMIKGREEDIFEKVLFYILKNNGNVTITELANQINYSVSHLYRICLKYLGVNLKFFLRIARLNAAINYLENSNDNLTSIAQNNGYYDQAHFVKEFKAICNITPSEYKKNMNDFYNQIIK